MPNYKLILNIISSINGGLITGAALLQTLIGQDLTIKIVAGLGICQIVISSITSSLSTQSSTVSQVLAMPGVEKLTVNTLASPALAAVAVSNDPALAKAEPAPGDKMRVEAIAKAAANILLAALLFTIFLSGDPASAQTRKPVAGPVLTGDLIQDAKDKFQGDPSKGVQLTGDIKRDSLAVWQKIQSASKTDLQYASLMAAAAKTPSADVRKRCWDAIIAINAQTNGEGLKNADGSDAIKPDPSLFTDVETIAEIMDSLSPQGPLFTSCSGAAELAKANVIQFISAAVSGAVGLAKLSPIPGL